MTLSKLELGSPVAMHMASMPSWYISCSTWLLEPLQTGHVTAHWQSHLGPLHQMLDSSTKVPTGTPRLRRSAGLDAEGQYLH